MTPDGRLAISGSSDRTLKVWNLSRPRAKPRTIKGYSGEAHALVLSPDGRLAVFGSLDHTLKAWDIRNNRLLSSFTGESKFVEVSISDDGRTIFAGGELGEIYILQLEGMETIS
jgi:WD40 repeat protein